MNERGSRHLRAGVWSSASRGRYPLVSHSMVDAERGAHGVVEVQG
ncbi:hypothetical protein [Rhodococcus artemisiae]|uniref:Uncharacterized protein n=1 Tax=Rhodococcus artemisiae TaxID=714159 RepID=A0ABU7LBH2_9NOCA|nr:hypothetical protein [Rhodococcus artemisiae]MEE2058888.1 hypothetical protein [Rhodococcus artemisiae]